MTELQWQDNRLNVSERRGAAGLDANGRLRSRQGLDFLHQCRYLCGCKLQQRCHRYAIAVADLVIQAAVRGVVMVGEQVGQPIAGPIFMRFCWQGRPRMNPLRRGSVQYVVH